MNAPKNGTGRGIVWLGLALAVLVALYTAYWFYAAGEIRARVEQFQAAGEQGLVTGWESFAMRGYPYRFEADFRRPSASAPDAPEEWSWEGSRASISLLPYNLRHAVLTLGDENRFTYRDLRTNSRARNELQTRTQQARASYVDLKDMPFGRLAIDVEGVEAQHFLGESGMTETLTARRLQLHARPSLNDIEELIPASYDMAVQAENVVVERTVPLPVLGGNIELLMAQTRLRNLPETRHASIVELLRAWQAAGGTLAISDLIVKWGPLDLTASGELSLDARKRLAGRLDARVSDFEKLVETMVREGVVKEEEARIALAGLVLISQFQGRRSNEVQLPIIFREGRLFLGPLAVAELRPIY